MNNINNLISWNDGDLFGAKYWDTVWAVAPMIIAVLLWDKVNYLIEENDKIKKILDINNNGWITWKRKINLKEKLLIH